MRAAPWGAAVQAAGALPRGLLRAAERHSAPVTHLGLRLVATVLTLAVLAGVVALMRLGWRHRAGRQSDLPPLPDAPDSLGELVVGPVRGTYVSTTTEGDWLDRVVVHGLGVRSEASLSVGPAGVLMERTGAPAVFLPSQALRGVRREPGMAGKFVGGDGLLVLSWELGGHRLDTGFRARDTAEHDRVERAVHELLAGARP
jgi:hypothetical protein